MNSDDKRKLKIGISISAFTVILYYGLQNFAEIQSAFGFVCSMLSPFIYGICFGFVLNILMKVIEEKLFSPLNKKNLPTWKKLKRPISALITVIIFLSIIAALISFVIPQLMQSCVVLTNNIPSYLVGLEGIANDVLSNFGVSTDISTAITSFFSNFSDRIITFVTNSVPKILQTTASITSGLVNVFLGFVLGIYMIITKEKLIKNLKSVVYAYAPKRSADYIAHVYYHINTRFTGFVSGQLTEAVIVGFLCFFGMTIFNMQYALLISVIVGVTNIIPIIGPIIGAIPGALIMLMVDPMKAVWFVVFIIVLQQLESNLIYPRVVGNSIGLPGLWVIFAIILGGGLFGFAGVLLGVPIFAVGYTLISENVQARLKKRADEEKTDLPPESSEEV